MVETTRDETTSYTFLNCLTLLLMVRKPLQYLQTFHLQPSLLECKSNAPSLCHTSFISLLCHHTLSFLSPNGEGSTYVHFSTIWETSCASSAKTVTRATCCLAVFLKRILFFSKLRSRGTELHCKLSDNSIECPKSSYCFLLLCSGCER